jgi:AcrR family transcriptional regulator
MAKRAKKKTFDEYPKGARELIVTAERLFGEHGIDGVSLRQIILRSDQANNSAIQHHFGTKMGLVQAVFEMRQVKLDAARAELLEKLNRKSRVEARVLLTSLMMPILEIMSETEQESFAMFMLRMTHLAERKHPSVRATELLPATNELQRRLRECFPEVPEDAYLVRYRLAVDVFLGGIAERRRLRLGGRFPASRANQFWDDILGITLAVLKAPYPPTASRSK